MSEEILVMDIRYPFDGPTPIELPIKMLAKGYRLRVSLVKED